MFAKKLKDALSHANMTQAQLAAKSGLTKASISQYIKGKHMPSRKAVNAIAAALDMPELYFTDEAEQINETNKRLPIRLTTQQAAKLMGVGAEMIRINLQNGALPFGYAMKGSGDRYVYSINTRQFMKYVGVTEQEVLEVV